MFAEGGVGGEYVLVLGGCEVFGVDFLFFIFFTMINNEIIAIAAPAIIRKLDVS